MIIGAHALGCAATARVRAVRARSPTMPRSGPADRRSDGVRPTRGGRDVARLLGLAPRRSGECGRSPRRTVPRLARAHVLAVTGRRANPTARRAGGCSPPPLERSSGRRPLALGTLRASAIAAYSADSSTPTRKSKEAIIATWIVPSVGARRLDTIRTADFTAIRTAMAEAGRNRKTTNNVLAVLSSTVKFWHDQHDRPVPHFKTGRVKTERHAGKRPKFFTEPEVAALVVAADRIGPRRRTSGCSASMRGSVCRSVARCSGAISSSAIVPA